MTRLTKPLRRATTTPLNGSFGRDSGKPLAVMLDPGHKPGQECITLWPLRTRNGRVTLRLVDVYRHGCWLQANRQQLERARAAKDRKARRLAEARQARAEKRLFRQEDRP